MIPELIRRKTKAMFRMSLCLFLWLFMNSNTSWANIPAVAAAADLKPALEETVLHYKKSTGRSVRLSFGSSGNFTHQIESGAPFEIFLSADEAMIFRLADRGLTLDRGHLYAIGRIVLFLPKGSAIASTPDWSGLKAALHNGQIKRFSIANPAHAPYGRAARAALEHQNVWTTIQPKLVLGENAAQATQFAVSSSAQGGIIPLSLTHSKEVRDRGQYVLIPAEWHPSEPLRQRMVLLKSAGKTAKEFYHYLQTQDAKKIFETYGFTIPQNQ